LRAFAAAAAGFGPIAAGPGDPVACEHVVLQNYLDQNHPHHHGRSLQDLDAAIERLLCDSVLGPSTGRTSDAAFHGHFEYHCIHFFPAQPSVMPMAGVPDPECAAPLSPDRDLLCGNTLAGPQVEPKQHGAVASIPKAQPGAPQTPNVDVSAARALYVVMRIMQRQL
jgi:hypothetical protein